MNRPWRSPIEIPELVKEYLIGKTFCEIGCGEGDLLQRFAKYTTKAIGIEINPIRFTKLDILEKKFNNIEIIKGDVFSNEIPKCDVYFVWTKLRFDKEIFRLLPKSTIISYKTVENKDWLENQYKKYFGKTEWIEFISNEEIEQYTNTNILNGKQIITSKNTPFVIGILHKE